MKLVKQYWEFPNYRILDGEGHRITVELEGNRYECTDMNSGYWQYLFGYRHPEFLKVLVNSTSHQPPSLFTSLHEEAEAAGKEIERSTGYSQALWLTSGSDAVDAAIRMADCIRPGRVIISIKNGFHGSNAAGLAVSGFEFMHRTSFFREERFLVIKPNGEGIAEIQKLASQDRLACVILEPVQGVGGAYVLPNDFAKALSDLRKRFDFFLIADEVSSFARTGNIFASQFFHSPTPSPQPSPLPGRGSFADIVCLGKGISGGYVPVSLVLASDEVIECHEQMGNFFYGNTLAGTPLACRLVRTTIGLLENGGLEKAKELGKHIDEEARNHSISLRGQGIMRAIDFGNKKHAEEVSRDLLVRNGFFTMPEGRYLMLVPPIVLPEAEVRRFFPAVKEYV